MSSTVISRGRTDVRWGGANVRSPGAVRRRDRIEFTPLGSAAPSASALSRSPSRKLRAGRREHVDAIYCAFIGRLRWPCRARGKREHSVVAFTSSFAGWPVADIKLHQLEHQAAESSSTAEHFSGVTEGGGEGRGGSCCLQAQLRGAAKQPHQKYFMIRTQN